MSENLKGSGGFSWFADYDERYEDIFGMREPELTQSEIEYRLSRCRVAFGKPKQDQQIAQTPDSSGASGS